MNSHDQGVAAPPPPITPSCEQALASLPAEVYLIGCGGETTNDSQPSAQTMGFKAWNLLRMARMSLPVPQAFVLGTHYCADAGARELASSPNLWKTGLHALERATGLSFGDARRPLLLSVRSGAPVSMPGMMETLLNVGLCDATVGGLLRQTGNPRLIWDAYRRLVATYAEVVAGLPVQLAGAIKAVFASWHSEKAREYRRLNRIPDAIGTAVTVQRMVFGNAGGQSGAGVGFTRDPTTGEPALWVDFLFNAQGEDVVSGRRSAHGHDELAAVLPAVWQALRDAARQLEHAIGDMQDFEFTVQDGRLFMLQTRDGKRTPRAAARIALDMLDEGLVTPEVACERTAGLDREALARPRIVAINGAALVPLARAVTASSGVAIGEIALDEARTVARHGAGVPIVLVRRDAETSDISALESATGLLTQRGARTSHAAVVARQLGKVCLVGCADLQIDETSRTVSLGRTTLHEGDLLTLDGNGGALYAGAVQTEIESPMALLSRLESLRQRVAMSKG